MINANELLLYSGIEMLARKFSRKGITAKMLNDFLEKSDMFLRHNVLVRYDNFNSDDDKILELMSSFHFTPKRETVFKIIDILKTVKVERFKPIKNTYYL